MADKVNPLVYDDGKDSLPDDCVFKISPSRFNYFIDKPFKWYREEVLGESGFDYNTSTVIGTVMHYIAEKVATKTDISKDDIYEYINMQKENDEYVKHEVLSNFEEMASVLVNQYVLPNMGNFIGIEQRFTAHIKEGFYASGQLDILEGTKSDCMISDYKSYNSKTQPKVIPFNYKYQLLVYAWILTKLKYTVSRVRLIYVNRNIDGGLSEKTGKPLKSYPSEVTVLTEVITDEDLEFIGSLLDLCVDTCLATDEYPELTHVIWHDPRLKVVA